jgi:hypothetical protein
MFLIDAAAAFPLRGGPIGMSVTSGSSSRTGRSETAVTEMVVTAWDCEPVALRETTLGALIDCGATEGEAILLGAGSG